MFDFILQKPAVSGAQRFIDKMEPKVNVHIPKDLPLPSISLIKRKCAATAAINGFEPELEALSDEQLRAKTEEFKQRFKSATQSAYEALKKADENVKGARGDIEREELINQLENAEKDLKNIKKKVLDGILPEAFAVVREASRRTIGLRHFDIQMVGGMVLHDGSIAEMATGEGKTLVATSPAYLNAITGEGVHIVTVNDYLAKRDSEWMGPIYEFLGLTVGVIQHAMDFDERRENYGRDITFGTNNEFGFDYLRDNMVNRKEEMVQRPHHFAIVDEVDSILIDEARTPLIISGPAEESTDKYYRAHEIAGKLKGRKLTENEQIEAKYKEVDLSSGFDYVAEEKSRSISLTDDGEEKAAKMFGIDNLHDMETIEYRHHILQSLKAKEFFKRDVDYVVRDGQVIIVDEFTGRMMPGRRWSDGLHQAVEAKEGIKIERENQTLATITFQNYFRMYEKLSGMTGTAHTEATEFEQIYKLETVVMPTNRVLQRLNNPDCVYKTTEEKFTAVVEEIKERYEKGQPVLVGTISIENSEKLSSMLEKKGVEHQVLNAKYHEKEAQIVAQAGRYKAITIATNMAGRGTDIVLGGNPEFMARSLADEKSGDSDSESQKDEMIKKFLQQFKEQCKQEHQKVIEAGGLYVLGTERHESRRIDNQLRGRSGRQGDPGESRFYVSLQDDLMRLFGSDKIMSVMDKLGMEEGQVIEHPWVSGALGQAQKRVETFNFEIRKQLLDFDNVMNKQREVIYGLRRQVLEREDVKDHVLRSVEDVVDIAVGRHLFTEAEEMKWDIEGLDVYLKAKFNFDIGPLKDQLIEKSKEEVLSVILEKLFEAYEEKERQMGSDQLRFLEKILLLHSIDTKWKDHLYAMDQLKEGIGLRSFAQRDPIIEYKREGFEMFQEMTDNINFDVAETIFKIQPASQGSAVRGVFDSVPKTMKHDETSGFSQQSQAAQSQQAAVPELQGPPQPAPQTPYQKDNPKVGRNDPCPCGSGKKFKKCCGR